MNRKQNKGYSQNQGGLNALSGYKGKHKKPQPKTQPLIEKPKIEEENKLETASEDIKDIEE
mgnify:CR=1 FL=1|tara:strand:+ start:336 stop:518 length:183 start_codon:yes stop_codon:yes gene_type:complete